MITIGLTGSIGMGKSTVAAMFAAEGVPVFDADACVHALQGPGGALVEAIERAFPGSTGIMGVDRARLGAMVLGDDAAMAQLEAIVHPAVGAARSRFLSDHADAPMILFDIPLLFETGGERSVDTTVAVTAPADVQRARVLARPGMTEAKFAAIRARQMPDAEKIARADFIIPTDGSMDETRAAVRGVIACLRARASG